jgi:erythromycin esterase
MRSLLLLGALALTGCAAGPGEVSPDNDSLTVVAWATEHAVKLETTDPEAPLDDLKPLREIVGDARVVFLGESRHDAGPQFRMKHRVIRFLVEEMGFDRFAIEDSLPGAGPLNEWVLGGDGDPEALLNRIGAWYIWDTAEVLALVKWMRSYNLGADTPAKVSYNGLDIVDAYPARESVMEFLDRVDPSYAAELRPGPVGGMPLDPDMWMRTLERYRELTDEEIESLGIALDELRLRLEEQRRQYMEDAKEYSWIVRQAWTLARAHELYTIGSRGSYVDAGTVREKAMADNVRRLLDATTPNGRLIVWCHNVHASKSPADVEVPERPPMHDVKQLGGYVAEMGYSTVAIGFAFDRGEGPGFELSAADPETVDGVLAQVGLPLFLLDLRSAPDGSPAWDWIRRKQPMRGQGGVVRLVPAEAYDALIFTETISRAVPNPRAVRRFETLGVN